MVHQSKNLNNWAIKHSIYISAFIAALMIPIQSVSATQGSLESCQKISDKIRYYSSLRKMGESAKTMENWKQQRKKHKEKFNSRNCKKWQDQLKH
jgi:hypothetical protein